MGERVTIELDSEALAAERAEAARKWYEENKEAIESINRMIEQDGFVFSDGARRF